MCAGCAACQGDDAAEISLAFQLLSVPLSSQSFALMKWHPSGALAGGTMTMTMTSTLGSTLVAAAAAAAASGSATPGHARPHGSISVPGTQPAIRVTAPASMVVDLAPGMGCPFGGRPHAPAVGAAMGGAAGAQSGVSAVDRLQAMLSDSGSSAGCETPQGERMWEWWARGKRFPELAALPVRLCCCRARSQTVYAPPPRCVTPPRDYVTRLRTLLYTTSALPARAGQSQRPSRRTACGTPARPAAGDETICGVCPRCHRRCGRPRRWHGCAEGVAPGEDSPGPALLQGLPC
jgi:hypothetical protein